MKKIFNILSILCISLLAWACSSDMEGAEQVKGYLSLELTTLESTNARVTSAPADYDAKIMHVDILNSDGVVVKSTDNFATDEEFQGIIMLEPGTYTIAAHSSHWDGSNSGFNAPFYAGTTSVKVKAQTKTTAKIKATLDNVKVTVNYDEDFKYNFNEAVCLVSSALEDVTPRAIGYESVKTAYFPVGDLTFLLSVTNRSGMQYQFTKTVTDVKSRDHYIINYKVVDHGQMGGITVKVDDATRTYNFDIEVPRKNLTGIEAFAANAWSTFADLNADVRGIPDFDINNLKLEWKQGDAEEWSTVPGAELSTVDEVNYTYRLANLQPKTNYAYRVAYAGGETNVTSNEVVFQTAGQEQLYNAGFEKWYMNGKTAICGSAEDGQYWDSSNAGSTTGPAASFGSNVTTQSTAFYHSGNSAAQLKTAYVVVKLAAASLFTGDFISLIDLNGAKLDWGVPFTSRPSALKGYLNYAPVGIDKGTKPTEVVAPAKGENDACQIFCALVTEQFHVANAANNDGYELSTKIDWENDNRVIAYGEMTKSTKTEANTWEEFNIPLIYHSTTRIPTHLIIVCSSSKWGDYFYGGDGSTLYLDDFEFEYGIPTMKK